MCTNDMLVVLTREDPICVAEAVLRAKFGDFANGPTFSSRVALTVPKLRDKSASPMMQKTVAVYGVSPASEAAVIDSIASKSRERCALRGCRNFSYFNGRMPPGNLVTIGCPCSAKYVKISPTCRVYASGDDRVIFAAKRPSTCDRQICVIVAGSEANGVPNFGGPENCVLMHVPRIRDLRAETNTNTYTRATSE